MENNQNGHSYKKAVFSGPEKTVIESILDACVEISAFLRHSPVFKLESCNLFGDKQLHQDVQCDDIIEKHLRKNSLVKGFAS
jgi:fructose-1,6-bisphosphatase